jgi:hypothetical protein
MMDDQAQVRHELTMTAAEANLYALVFVIPILLLFGVPYYLLYLRNFTAETLMEFLNNNRQLLIFSGLWVLIVLFAGIILHELIHGIAFLFFCKNGIKSIRFGIMWRFLTPYCHCKEPLKVRYYIIGALMPAVIMGFFPACFGIITGKIVPLLLGIFFSFAAGGDFLIVWLLRKQPGNSLVLDHESKVGCYIIEE